MGEIPFDRERFLRIAGETAEGGLNVYNIGTLSEKTLHLVLKRYFAADTMSLEVPLAGSVADLVGEGRIIEIQTRSFEGLTDKLEKFLPILPVTLVYPIVQKKWVITVQDESGEVSERRRSPKIGRLTDIFPEMMSVSHFLTDERLTVRAVLLEAEEYRIVSAQKKNRHGKPATVRYERIPLDILGVYDFSDARDYKELLPFGREETFTNRELLKALHSRAGGRKASALSYILQYVGAIERVGKQGNAYLYKISEKS